MTENTDSSHDILIDELEKQTKGILKTIKESSCESEVFEAIVLLATNIENCVYQMEELKQFYCSIKYKTLKNMLLAPPRLDKPSIYCYSDSASTIICEMCKYGTEYLPFLLDFASVLKYMLIDNRFVLPKLTEDVMCYFLFLSSHEDGRKKLMKEGILKFFSRIPGKEGIMKYFICGAFLEIAMSLEENHNCGPEPITKILKQIVCVYFGENIGEVKTLHPEMRTLLKDFRMYSMESYLVIFTNVEKIIAGRQKTFAFAFKLIKECGHGKIIANFGIVNYVGFLLKDKVDLAQNIVEAIISIITNNENGVWNRNICYSLAKEIFDNIHLKNLKPYDLIFQLVRASHVKKNEAESKVYEKIRLLFLKHFHMLSNAGAPDYEAHEVLKLFLQIFLEYEMEFFSEQNGGYRIDLFMQCLCLACDELASYFTSAIEADEDGDGQIVVDDCQMFIESVFECKSRWAGHLKLVTKKPNLSYMCFEAFRTLFKFFEKMFKTIDTCNTDKLFDPNNVYYFLFKFLGLFIYQKLHKDIIVDTSYSKLLIGAANHFLVIINVTDNKYDDIFISFLEILCSYFKNRDFKNRDEILEPDVLVHFHRIVSKTLKEGLCDETNKLLFPSACVVMQLKFILTSQYFIYLFKDISRYYFWADNTDSDLEIRANLLTIAFMIWKENNSLPIFSNLQDTSKRFFKSAMNLLITIHSQSFEERVPRKNPSTNVIDVAQDLPNLCVLWMTLMSLLIEFIQIIPWAADFFLDGEWIKQLIDHLFHLDAAEVAHYYKDCVERFLSSLLRNRAHLRDILRLLEDINIRKITSKHSLNFRVKPIQKTYDLF